MVLIVYYLERNHIHPLNVISRKDYINIALRPTAFMSYYKHSLQDGARTTQQLLTKIAAVLDLESMYYMYLVWAIVSKVSDRR